MEELKKFELNNKILEDFDKLMTFHLDQVEELSVKEIFINPKLYNIISLCTNLKTLIIEGDLRMDVNKIVFNICKPERLETLILNSVKLPTNNVVQKLTSLKTISLTNITFSDVNGFFGKLPNKEALIAINLTNVDLGKKSINICSQFTKLRYLNLNNLKNCKFDDLEFLTKVKLKRFEFRNNMINFEQINSLTKGGYIKDVNVKIETNKKSNISNFLEIDDNKVSLTINTNDIDKLVENTNLYKIDNLFIILENKIDIENYIRSFKKVKDKITISIKNISYLSSECARKFRDKLDVRFVTILSNDENTKGNSQKCCYPVDEYIEMREKLEQIVEKVSNHTNDIEKFNDLYSYIKNNIKYTEDKVNIKDVLLNNKCSYNLYSAFINSVFSVMNIENKIIKGISNTVENATWNQIKLDGEWFNVDIANECIGKKNKKYSFKAKLLNDEQFYKTHVVQYGKPEKCNILLEQKKKELKNSVKKVTVIEKIIVRFKKIFTLNKVKALPAPDDKSEK